ncbi:MAG: TonB-dependent receptor [Bacteroidetes bacterium]|nr:TonB-dependent receptor [Bacteroidota bacterium]
MRIVHVFILFLILFASIAAPQLSAQDIHGTVLGVASGNAEALPGAHIYWLGSKRGTVSDEHGHFLLSREQSNDRRIIVSHVAFEPETLDVADLDHVEIRLTRPRTQDEVEVTAKAPATFIAPIDRKTEVITAKELEKAACCELSGCFGTTSSVQADAVDIITDTRQLKMLGLEGVYTQLLLDNIPGLNGGLNTHFGVSFIPGPFIDRIMVSKGATSVLQGGESFSGLINVLLRESDGDEPLFFNAFTNNYLEQQYNAYAMKTYGDWSGMIALHGARRGNRHDGNGDGFLDMPLTDRFSALGKWKFDGVDKGVISRLGVKFTWEERLGGQMDYDNNLRPGNTGIYGQTIRNDRFEVYNKTDFDLGDGQALKFHLATSVHTQDAWYGSTRYDADERVIYGDLAWASPWAEHHTITTGVSFLSNQLEERIDLGANPLAKSYAGNYNYDVLAPGIFMENKFNFFHDDLAVITGARMDFRNDEGNIFTPRLFVRYSLDEMTTLRGSVGTAFRVARLFVEHPAVLASWRDIRIEDNLEGERALNYGVSLLRLYDLGVVAGSINLDVYRTEFSRQVIAEYDLTPDAIVFKNIDGNSAADNIAVELTGDVHPLSFRFSYTYTDVYQQENGNTRTLPFVTRDRVLASISAVSNDDAWLGTVTAEWRGPQQLPETSSYPEEFRLPTHGDAYLVLNLHAQRRWQAFDLYFGVDNLLNFRQATPIINAANPFSRYFEPGFAWGPVRGREVYLGIRARINVL